MSEPSSGAPSLNGRLAGAHPAVSSNGARRPERVLVVGGGAVGLCVAEALLSRGAAVTLLERERCGAGASTGNAGWVTPSLAIPVPAPGVIGESLRWLINPSGPLWIRPTLSRHMIAWISHFMASCSQATHRRGLRALQAAARDAGESFDALAGRGVHFELHAEGLLYPALEQAELQLLLGMLGALERAGARDIPDRLGPAELLELEPALHPRVVGGVFARGERGVRPESLVAGLQGAVTELGGEIVQGAAVTGLAREGAGWRVQTPAGPRRGDAVVLANGVAAVGLLAGLGGRGRWSPPRGTAALTPPTPPGRAATSTSRGRAWRSAATTARRACRARWSSARAGSGSRRGAWMRSAPGRHMRCPAGGCPRNPSTGPGCGR